MTGLPHPDNAAPPERGAAVHFPPPLVFAIAIGVGTAMNRWVYPLRFDWSMTTHTVVGLAIAALGVGLAAWAGQLFRKTGQDPIPWKPSPSMIATGPYRYSRNPMYIGMTLLQVGIGVGINELWIAVLAPISLAVVHFIAVVPEERYLESKFRDNYRTYLARVRRYI